MKRITSIMLIISISLMVMSFSVPVSAKVKGAPVINYTLSETETTNDPVTINLDITDPDGSVSKNSVTYVEVDYAFWYWFLEDQNFSASLSYSVDVEKEVIELLRNNDSFADKYENMFENEYAGYLVDKYYETAYPSVVNGLTDDFSVDDCVKQAKDWKIEVEWDTRLIVCAEDLVGNKTFRYIEVDNISPGSIQNTIISLDDMSSEHLAELDLEITENPRNPIEKITVFYGNGIKPDGVIWNPKEFIENDPRWIIEPVDGKYYLDVTGAYHILVKGETRWIYKEVFFKLPSIKDEIEVSYKERDDNSVEVFLYTGNTKFRQLKYAQADYDLSNYYGETSYKKMFFIAENKNDLVDNTFVAEYDKSYVVQAVSQDLCDKYLKIQIKKSDTSDDEVYVKNIKLFDSSDNSIISPTVGEGFKIKADIANASELTSGGVVLATVYDKSGAILKTEQAELNTATGNNSYEFNIQPLDSEAGSIKVFVWDSIDTMTPLADAKSIDF